MKKKHRMAVQYGHPEHGSPGQAAPSLRLTPVKIGIGLGVILLGATALVTLSNKDRPAGAGIPRAVPADLIAKAVGASATPAASSAADGNLPAPVPGNRTPINDTDPFTGKPINASSPTVEYKGHVIAFCCADSSGYKGGWNRMSESEKDAVVRRYVK